MSSLSATEASGIVNIAPAPPVAGATPPTSVTKTPRIHSCVLCQQRKVKCDRQNPCAGCIKAGVECIASVPAPPRRRKRKLPEIELQAKLQRYKDLLRGYGAQTDEDGDDAEEFESDQGPQSWRRHSGFGLPKRPKQTDGGMMQFTSPGSEQGKMVSEQGMSKYLDNNLWTGLSEELSNPQDILRPSPDIQRFKPSISDNIHTDGSTLLFGSVSPDISLTSIHPQPVHIFRLWQTFLDNVNPLSKIIHYPTMQHQILEVIGNPSNIPRPLEALLFSIYAAAVASLDNAECESTMGESRATLLSRYTTATQQALIRIGFLKSSDLVVLQAFTLYLLSMRQYYDPNTLWILTGVAVRIGQRMGIHRDTSMDLSPFESEMRRRICWQIVLLDSRSAQLAGTGISVTNTAWDSKLPSNVNDSDLNPEMREMPLEHTGITEMVFCLVRYQFGNFLRGGITNGTGFDGNWARLSSNSVPLAEKDQLLDELENTLETKFLRYCDPLIPLHMLSATVARTAICKMRLVAHHPRQYPDNGASMPQEEKDMLFATSLKMIEYENLGQSLKSMKRFLWHINNYFQLDAFVYLLSELRRRTEGPMVDRAWEQIQEVYDNHPELITDNSNALFVAVGNLTLKAWTSREAELRRNHRGHEVPNFIRALRPQGTDVQHDATNVEPPNNALEDLSGYAAGEAQPDQPQVQNEEGGMYTNIDNPAFQFDPLTMDFSPVDWDYWTDLLEANELQYLEGNGQKLFGQ